MDFKFSCPACDQHLVASAELAGISVACPSCAVELVIPQPPPTAAPINETVKQWTVDVRVLVLRAPPIYIQTLIEAPKGWVLSADGLLPEPALEAVTKAVGARYARCPITPIKVRPADAEALKKTTTRTDYSDENCKVWLLGRPSSIS